jgi:hypothetical protein
MKADLTRSTFDAVKHYRSVRMQQGRVQLDADWNEQQDIVHHRIERETADALGPLAAPADGGGFHLGESGGSIVIGKGHIYVDGVLCENETDNLPADGQPDLPGDACVIVDGKTQGLPPPIGVYLGFIHVWQRHLTALEDPLIREVALGGPDTATRLKNLWQVQLLQASKNPDDLPDCTAELAAWNDLIRPSSGMLAARAEAAPASGDPCKLSPTAGYRRLDNLLYRVEMHLMPGMDPAFKWSHDNGAIETSWLSSASSGLPNLLDLGVATLGRDAVLTIAPGQWVELFDDTTELLGIPGTLVQVKKAESGTVTVDVTPANVFPAGAATDIGKFPSRPRLRRWDGWRYVKEAVGATADSGWLGLEDGVQIKFDSDKSVFRHGDYWMFAARAGNNFAAASIEWPTDSANLPVFRLPDGIPHGYGRLAMLRYGDDKKGGNAWSVLSDCRPLFPSLTQLIEMTYVGGDAQVVELDEPLTLPRPLEVGVTMGSLPVCGVTVRFTVEHGVLGNGSTSQDVLLAPSDRGVAAVSWTLDGKTPHQYAQAILLEGGQPSTGKYLPVRFSASLIDQADCACTVCVSAKAQADDPTALQRAISGLNAKGGGVLCLGLGEYVLKEPLRIVKGRITMQGKGRGTVIRSEGAAVEIGEAVDVRLGDFTVRSASSEVSYAALSIGNVRSLRLDRLSVDLGSGNKNSVAILFTGGNEDVRLVDCELLAGYGLVGGALPDGKSLTTVSIDGLQVHGSLLSCAANGLLLQLNSFRRPLDITGNRFEGCASGAMFLSGSGEAGAGMQVSNNSLSVSGYGIKLISDGAIVSANTLAYVGPHAEASGIYLSDNGLTVGHTESLITNNRIAGFPFAGIQVEHATGKSIISFNQVTGGIQGIVQMGTQSGASVDVTIEGNEISDIDTSGDLFGWYYLGGIYVAGMGRARIAGNLMRRIAQSENAGAHMMCGIQAYIGDRIEIVNNDLTDLAPQGKYSGWATGIYVLGVAHLEIAGNHIERDSAATGQDESSWNGMIIGSAEYGYVMPTANPKNTLVEGTDQPILSAVRPLQIVPKTLPMASNVTEFKDFVSASLTRSGASAARGGWRGDWATVRSNRIFVRGRGVCCQVVAQLSGCDFSGNQCTRLVDGTSTGSTDLAYPSVMIIVNSVTASHNEIFENGVPAPSGDIGVMKKAGVRVAATTEAFVGSMVLGVANKAATSTGANLSALGNVTSRGIGLLPGGSGAILPLGAPWAGLNVSLVGT